jgi:hypothetical protein
MRVDRVKWPAHGNRVAFARAIGVRMAIGSAVIVAVAAVVATSNRALVAPTLPLATGAIMVTLLWAHSQAQRLARRAEILRSFAGMAITHGGHVIRINDTDAFTGEFTVRSDAVRAAVERGRWAVIVRAYDRYYVLAGQLVPRVKRTELPTVPLSFRSSAVAHVVPSIMDDAISA